METNKIDEIVRNSLKNRTIEPSKSAWERLSNQLDEVQEKKRKHWLVYFRYAAGILLLIALTIYLNQDDDLTPITPSTIVTSPIIDTNDLVKPTIENVIPTETVIVEKTEPQRNEKKLISKTFDKSIIAKKKSVELENTIIKDTSTTIIADVSIKEDKKLSTDKAFTQTKTTSRIVIDADALLYSVTNPKKDISEYYAKYNIDRDKVLKSIRKELKKINLKIDANTLLTEVEKKIDEDTFKRNFMHVVKGKITGLATAFVNRNK